MDFLPSLELRQSTLNSLYDKFESNLKFERAFVLVLENNP